MKDPRIEKLKFYMEEGEDIQLKLENGLLCEGKIIKIRLWFTSYAHIILQNGESKMKCFIGEIKEGSIFPVSLDTSQLKSSYNRKSIPQSVRKELWRNFFGEQREGSCFVCKDTIEDNNFEAGHVVAHAEGGADTVDNLRPICRTCNRSMGTQNLLEFKEEYH